MSQQTDDLQAWLQNLGIEPPKAPKKKAKPPALKKVKAKVQMALKAEKKKETPPAVVVADDAYNCSETTETEAQDIAAYQTDNNAYTETEVNNDIHSIGNQKQKKKKSPHHGLFTSSNLKNAIIIQEVLGKPKSLQ